MREAAVATQDFSIAFEDEYTHRFSNGEVAEDLYRAMVPLEHRKKYGQFFTPPPIAELMTDWIAEISPKSILDPSVGPGILSRAAKSRCPSASLTCLEIDPLALGAAQTALRNSAPTLIRQDFLTWSEEPRFDAAIANPPYLRHHDFTYSFDIFELIERKNSIKLSRLSNMYVLFILEICRRLRVGGRAAIIVPGEWANANFGENLKLWLIREGLLHTLLYFSHLSSQFAEALTTASILFIEKPARNQGRKSVRTIFVPYGCPTEVLREVALGGDEATGQVEIRQFTPEQLLEEKKWNHLLAHGQTERKPGFVPLSELASTRRGIATGSNSFFHITPSIAIANKLRHSSLTPCVGRATDAPFAVFDESDFQNLKANDGRTFLFDLRDEPDENESVYISRGETEGLHERFLCANRRPNWYSMEQRPPAPIWAAVFGREGLRFIHNRAMVANLTTFHCIYPSIESTELAASLTACLNSRIVQDRSRRHHRVYGDGLLKFEPKDLLDIEVPDLRLLPAETVSALGELLPELDAAMRTGRNTKILYEELDRRVSLAAEIAAKSNHQAGSKRY